MKEQEAREAAWEKESCKGCEACQFEGDGSCDDWARQLFVKGFDAGVEYANRWTYLPELPPRKKGWDHTDEVLVWYEGGEQKTAKYGIAYYHYEPPHRDPEWVDFANLGRVPIMWKTITKPVSRGEADEC